MKKTLNKFLKSPWSPICLIGLTIIFFSLRLIITYDSAHYLNYVAIFEGNAPVSSWDIVRGPVFPALIFIFDVLFGKTNTGILVGTFIFYLIFSFICYKVCKEICQNLKHKKLTQNIILAIIILNPLIMGFFHVLLTEFVAITLTMLNILLAYKWIYCDTHNKKHLILYSLYFIFSLVFGYHLKQPYIIISIIPPVIASIISLCKKHSVKNIAYRLGTIILAIIFLFISIVSWNKILEAKGIDMDTGRDSASLFSRQILEAYQISYDQNNDGKTDQISTLEALGILSNEFFSNPLHIITIYISNYCGLSSVCVIETENGVGYTSTLSFSGFDIYENGIIGYRAYKDQPNIFDMPEKLYHQASIYGDTSDRSLIAHTMNIFQAPTNILFKVSTILCLPFIVLLIIIKIKYKNKKFIPLFYLNIILLTTSFLHLALSAGIGLIIDRYAIEIFIPSTLGIIGTIIYTQNVLVTESIKHKKTIKRLNHD